MRIFLVVGKSRGKRHRDVTATEADKKAFPENVLPAILKDRDKMASLVHTALKNCTKNKESTLSTTRDAKTFYVTQYLMTICHDTHPTNPSRKKREIITYAERYKTILIFAYKHTRIQNKLI